jgi:hypothetical protein
MGQNPTVTNGYKSSRMLSPTTKVGKIGKINRILVYKTPIKHHF